MNLIERPPEDAAASLNRGATRAKRAAPTQETGTDTHHTSDLPVGDAAATKGLVIASAFDDVNALLSDPSRIPDNSTQSGTESAPAPPPLPTNVADHSAIANTNPADVGPLLPTDEWESHQAHGRRQFVLICMACMLGMGTALGGVSWVVMRAVSDAPASPAPTTVELREDELREATATHRDQTLDAGKQVDDTTLERTPDPESVSDSANSEPSIDESGVPLPVSSQAEGQGADLSERAPAIANPSPPTVPEASDQLPVAESPQPVRDTFDEMTADLDALSAESSDGASAGARAPSADVRLRQSVPQPIQPRVRRVNVAQRLQDPIPQISLPPMSVARFLDWFMNFTTIPVTVDPLALQQARISLEAPVSIAGADLTVGQMLRDALATCRLGYLVDDSQLVIVAASSMDPSLRRRPYDAADLLSQDGDGLVHLVSFVESMVDPSSWQRHGGAGKIQGEKQRLMVTQTVSAHFEVLVCLEKLRVARGLRIRSRYPADLFSATTRRRRAAAALEIPVDARFLRPTPVRQIVGSLGGQADMQLLVDWRALASAGWTDKVAMSLEMPPGPLEDPLQRLLAAMDLTYRVFDARTIQITTRDAELATFDLEAYTIGDLMARGWDSDRVLEAIRMQFGAERFTPQGGGALAVDAESQTLFVRLPQSQQVLLETALNSLRNS